MCVSVCVCVDVRTVCMCVFVCVLLSVTTGVCILHSRHMMMLAVHIYGYMAIYNVQCTYKGIYRV